MWKMWNEFGTAMIGYIASRKTILDGDGRMSEEIKARCRMELDEMFVRALAIHSPEYVMKAIQARESELSKGEVSEEVREAVQEELQRLRLWIQLYAGKDVA